MAGAAAGWFDERVRPLLRYPTGDSAAWVPLGSVVDEPLLERIEQSQLRGAGAPAKVALTTAAGWMAGYVTAALAVGLLRDGVLVRLSAASGAHALQEKGGWLCDVRFQDAPLVVPPGHALAGEPGVAVVEDPAAEFGAELERVCGPWLAVLAKRSRRGKNGLWAMAADSVGTATSTLAAAESGRSLQEWTAAVDELLRQPGVPWRHRPTMRVVQHEAAGPVFVQHRASCCLWYRCDPDAADDPAAVRADIEEEPNYCSTCLFRDAADVEARALSAAAPAQQEP